MATFPTIESELNSFFHIAVAYLLVNFLRLGVSAENKTTMNECLVTWDITYPLATNPGTSTEANVHDKNDALVAMVNILRIIFGDIPLSKLLALDRSTLHIPVVGGPHAAVPLPDSECNGVVNSGNRLVHKISYSDSVTGKKAKPHGASGAELYSKMGGTEPKDVSEMVFIDTLTKSPFIINYIGEQAGIKVWYWMRWISKHEKGNWGPGFSGTILP